MLDWLWIIPVLPLISFLILVLFGSRLSKSGVAIIGVGSIGISALITILTAYSFITDPPDGYQFSQSLWIWVSVSGFSPQIAFYLDPLALVFMLVVTMVGFLIHLYAAEYMADEEGYSRFFAYMNLFVGAMLILVMGDNLLLLYLGWEGVGLCSYLLIGFWYKDPLNGYAARKAFVVTRVGDTAMAVGLFIMYSTLGTMHIQNILSQVGSQWAVGSTMAITTAALLLGGVVGKSAQLPLQTWLPDAMAGPTPVSALIHAATMVTAGVYLIARMNVIFTLAPVVQLVVAIVGAVTLLLAGFSALVQTDIKRVLAYSTISQIGYMFLALGVGAWAAGIFHFMTHAFFKALLFMGAGAIIVALHHEQNMFKMGGLKKLLPVTFWTFLIGSASLVALPLITAGFYSKDMILWYTWSSDQGAWWLWVMGLLGAFMTAVYTFRMVFITFYGEVKIPVHHPPGKRMEIPLIILAVLSIVGGFLDLPHNMGHITIFSDFMQKVLPAVKSHTEEAGTETIFQIISSLVAIIGIYVAYILYLKHPVYSQKLARIPLGALLKKYWHSGWGFDWFYDHLFVFPFLWLARINKRDFIDSGYSGIAWINRKGNEWLVLTQNGNVRWYAMGIAFGAVATLILIVVLL
jgi:NADH-quinone oxidoreductase subunit L